jgi:hypothetical protein
MVSASGWNMKKSAEEKKSDKVSWEWLSNQSGWRAYSVDEMEILEAAFQEKKPSVTLTNQYGQYLIHLTEKQRVQVNQKSKFKRPVRRYCGDRPPCTVRSGSVIACIVDLDLRQCTWIVDSKHVFKSPPGLNLSDGGVRAAVSVRGADKPQIRGGDGRAAPRASRQNMIDLNFGRRPFKSKLKDVRTVWEARSTAVRSRRFSHADESSKVDDEDEIARRVLERYFSRNKTKIDAVASGLGVTGGLNGILSELLGKNM